ncbi:hypothetical protein DL96DRAFT_1571435 [Flagelloscypha sp. PMI_526]|nr:hypothetical protein DL96DRAFT_1571435 [Flagelloscypha sp. PMI_526]
MASATTMSADELEVLNLIGRNLNEDIVNIIMETIWWAGYGVLFCFAVYILISRWTKSSGSFIMLAATVLLFTSSTVLWALDVYVMITRYKIRLIDNPGWGLEDRYALSQDTVYPIGVPMEALFMLNMLIGDGVVLWRASVLWPRKRLVLLVPSVFLTGSFVFAVVDIVCLMNEGYGTKSAIPEGSRACTWAEPIAWAMSLCTNLISTSLIAWKAWKHRQFIKKNFALRPKRTQTEKVLMLLVESGFLYCAFWILQVIDFIDISRDDRTFFLYGVVSTMGDQISGLYPTGIIVLVALQQTVQKATTYHGESMSTATHKGTTLEFAPTSAISESHNTTSATATADARTSGTLPVTFQSIGEVEEGSLDRKKGADVGSDVRARS